MGSGERHLAAARLDERLARARWTDTLGLARHKAKPSVIAKTAFDNAKQAGQTASEKAKETVRNNPGKLLAIGSGAALFMMRKPIVSAIKSKISQRRETKNIDDKLS